MTKAGRDSRNITSARAVRDAQRRAEMLSLRLDGLTLEQIGERMGVGKPTVSRVISRSLVAHIREPAEELLALELGRCDTLLREAMKTVRTFHPLVSAGRVVTAPMIDDNGKEKIDAETGEVLTHVLEDEAPKLAAIAAAVRIMERRARLLGLDAPNRLQQELTVAGTEQAQDMTRLDDADLGLYCYLISKATDTSSSPAKRDIRREMREKLTANEIGILHGIFQKLDVPYLAAEAALGLHAANHI